MGDYTSVGLVRSATGIDETTLSSGVLAFCVSRGEALMKKYLGKAPPSGSKLEMWARDAATLFAAYYAMQRLASEHAPFYYYARDVTLDRGAEFRGRSIMAESFYNAAKRICDMEGRKIIIDLAEPEDDTAESAES